MSHNWFCHQLINNYTICILVRAELNLIDCRYSLSFLMQKRRSDCSHHVKIIVACTGMRSMNHFDTGYCISNNNSIHHRFLHFWEEEEKEKNHHITGLFYLHPGLTKYKTKSFICSKFMLSDKIMEVVKARNTT